ncbi:hypothetical protein KY361_05515 [Candidatus Woesearchaeota archaeon]|nr:hypothetical protein [Candidatus Woesearchaeota archaeon]
MKKDVITYSVYIIATILVAFILIQTNKVSDQELFELALNRSDVSFCSRINPDIKINGEERTDTKISIQGFAVLRDVCFSEFAEPYDDKLAYCENVSYNQVRVCEEDKCFDMSAREACYREVFKDYVSFTMPPQEGEIQNKETCEKLSMFRDNCKYLYAVTTGDDSVCVTFDNLCPLRTELCQKEAAKVNAPPLDLGDAVVYRG